MWELKLISPAGGKALSINTVSFKTKKEAILATYAIKYSMIQRIGRQYFLFLTHDKK